MTQERDDGWEELYDAPDTAVESRTAGLTRTGFRFLAEMKFNVLLFVSLQAMNTRSDDRTHMVCEASCATDGMEDGTVGECLAVCADYEENWLSKLRVIDATCVWAILVMNSCLLIYICFRPSEALPFGMGKWRKADYSLCFHINEFYSTQLATFVKILSAAATLALIVSDLRVAMTSTKPMTLMEAWAWNANSWLPALIATANLHRPARELANVRFAVFEKSVRGVEAFAWMDLLKSAPALLQSKVTSAAFKDLCNESEAQRAMQAEREREGGRK